MYFLLFKAKEMEKTIQELEDKLNSAQQALNDKEEQLEKLKEEQDAVFPDNPDQVILKNKIDLSKLLILVISDSIVKDLEMHESACGACRLCHFRKIPI